MLWGQNKVGGVVNVTEKYIERSFVSIHKRPISDLPFENTSMNACCTPGARKLYVKANGDFIPCERLGDVEPIGNVYDGLYVDTIKRTRQNTSWAAK